ncbi:MAG: hypothetical protein IJ584_05000, partial [Bacteroidales bacterium]|nr:hypothetical protein [Bacteroidales bacterium]
MKKRLLFVSFDNILIKSVFFTFGRDIFLSGPLIASGPKKEQLFMRNVLPIQGKRLYLYRFNFERFKLRQERAPDQCPAQQLKDINNMKKKFR